MTAEQIIKEWLDYTQQSIANEYYRLEYNASGSFERSLEPFYEQNKYNYKFGIMGNYYAYWMERGRKKTTKGSKPGKLKDIILQWIKDKGLPVWSYTDKKTGKVRKMSRKGQAYIITRKIHEKGWKSKGTLISNVVTQPNLATLLKDIGGVMVANMKSEIIDLITDTRKIR